MCVCVWVSQVLDAHDRHMCETLVLLLATIIIASASLRSASLRCAASPFLSSSLLRLGQEQPLQPVQALQPVAAVATGRSRCNRSQPLQRPVGGVQRQDRRALAGDRRLHGRARRSGRRVSAPKREWPKRDWLKREWPKREWPKRDAPAIGGCTDGLAEAVAE